MYSIGILHTHPSSEESMIDPNNPGKKTVVFVEKFDIISHSIDDFDIADKRGLPDYIVNTHNNIKLKPDMKNVDVELLTYDAKDKDDTIKMGSIGKFLQDGLEENIIINLIKNYWLK